MSVEQPRRPSEAVIEFDDVDMRYPDGTAALRSIDLAIPSGAFCFLTGPSGAGKSTLLKLILCAERASAGAVRVAGYDLARIKPRSIPFLRRNIGVVFQDFKLLQSRNAAENAAMALEVRGAPRQVIRSKVHQILAQVGLRDREHLRPGSLSGGEQQRLAVARAILGEPAIVLADEPTGNLDPALGREILELLIRIHQRGTTLIVATHDPVLVEQHPEARQLHLEGGRLVEDLEGAAP